MISPIHLFTKTDITPILFGRSEWIESNNLGNHQRYNIGITVEYQWLAGERMVFQLGASEYYYSNWGSTFIPGIDLRYQITDKIVWQSAIGRTFRIPTFTELYYKSPSNKGNSDLNPESGWTADHNLSWNQAGLSATIGLFIRQGEKQIDWVREHSDNPWQVQNISRIRSSGLETSLNYLIDNAIFRSISISYCTINTIRSDFGFESKYLLSALRHQLIASVVPITVFGIQQGWTLRYEDRMNSQNQMAINANFSRRFKQISATLGINNLLNNSYVNCAGLPMPGCSLNFNIEYSPD